MPDFFTSIFAPGHWPIFALVSARLGGFMTMAPLWSITALPKTARAALTVLLSVLLMPGVHASALPESWVMLPLPLASEMAIGIVIGLTAAVIVQGLTLAGEVLSIQMGLNLGPALGPMPDLEVSGLGQLQSLLALTVYVSIGGHLMLLSAFADSLRVLPPGGAIDFDRGGHAVMSVFPMLYSCALRAAAPVMITLLLSNLALAILSRAVPQLNTMMVSLPVMTALGLMMFGAALPLIATAVRGWMEAMPGTSSHLVQALRPAP